jgi:uncharacterized surface protein with fasciclin (FAS1) repeats
MSNHFSKNQTMKQFFSLLGSVLVGGMAFAQTNTVVDIVVNSENHNTLETAVIAAGLVETLSGDGPFTVFAPTDDAFAALPDGTLDAVLADNDMLTAILTYHVVGSTALSTDLMDGMAVTTLNGEDVTVTINMDGVFINDAQVTVADLVADNGVVHVIDAVLLPAPPPSNTVVDIIVNSEVHTTLETAVIAAGLAGTLSGDGPFTVFAPTDDAFAGLPAGTIEAVLADPALLTAILTYHVVGSTALSTDLMDGMAVTTLNGADVTVTINMDGVFINDAQVTVADLVADNGVVHVIDAVLLPPPPPSNTVVDIIVNSENHNTLETAVIAAGLVETLSGDGPFTVFAPTDDAFAGLPEGTLDAVLADIDLLTAILTYHVAGTTALSTDLMDGMAVTTLNGADVTVTINADGVFINDAQVTVADIIADNGVVHVIDAVLLPPAPPTNTVVDIIVNSENHNTLETAVIAAGLVETLSGDGPFTVFAPTDDAFAGLPDGTLDAVLADIDLLTAILTYHVAGTTALSTDLMDGMAVTTLNGADVTVTINADGVFINDAQVTVADLVADNGVVHVIDAVLLPPTPDAVEEATASFNVFPNPATTWVRIDGLSSRSTVVLRDAHGRLVVTPAMQAQTMNVEGLPAGMYFLEIQEGTAREVKPLVVR